MVCKSPREGALETQVRRYPQSYRRRLRKLAGISSRLGDLLWSFPGAAFALVSGHATPEVRGRGVALVKNGSGLEELAATLGLPLWLRRVQPEAYTEPLGDLPDGPDFNREIVNFIPDTDEGVAMWLKWLSFANASCNSQFALWIARQRIYGPVGDVVGTPVLPLAAYAWFSNQECGPARGLIRRPWRRNIGLAKAIDETIQWVDRIAMEFTVKPRRRGPGRYSGRGITGYQVQPLITRQALIEEGRVMNHCVASYASMVANGECLIFSIRHGNLRVATVEVRPRSRKRPNFAVVQLQGPGNSPVSQELRKAVNEWVDRSRGDFAKDMHLGSEPPISAKQWQRIWQPFANAKARFALPAERASLYRLRHDANQLEHLLRS